MNLCNVCGKRSITYGLDAPSQAHVGRCNEPDCTMCDAATRVPCRRGLAARLTWEEHGMIHYADVCFDHMASHRQMFNPHVQIDYYTHLSCEDDPAYARCRVCARRDCPYGDESHYTRAGCPVCIFLLGASKRRR